jgi:hypothetical protein
MTVNAVFVTEINPPPDVEPLDWLLLTSLPIDTLANVLQVVDYYTSRWQIEVFFKVLKQGCTVERLQLQKARRVENCLALYCIVAWRILHVTMLGRECPNASCAWSSRKPNGRRVVRSPQNRPLPRIHRRWANS